MVDNKLYKVALTMAGNYVHGTHYDALTWVFYDEADGGDNCSYVSVRENQNVVPGTDPDVWRKVCKSGEQGDPGAPGEDGAPGATGERGPAGVESVNVSVSQSTGIPSGSATVSNGVMALSLTGVKGEQGNSGYTGAVGELEVVNNRTDGGATAAWSAEQGKLLSQQTTYLGDVVETLSSGKIREVEDYQEALVYPVTHERAVIGTDGVNLETRLQQYTVSGHTKLVPEDIQSNTKIHNNYAFVHEVETVDLYVYPVEELTHYRFSARSAKTWTLYFVYWLDSEGVPFAREPYKGEKERQVRCDMVEIVSPAGAAYCAINVEPIYHLYHGFYKVDYVTAQEIYDDMAFKSDVSGIHTYDYAILTPDSVEENRGEFGADDFRNSSYYDLAKYTIEPGRTYNFCGYMRKTLTLRFISWYNASDVCVKRESYQGHMDYATKIYMQEVTAPSDAAYAYFNIDKNNKSYNALYRQEEVTQQELYDKRKMSDVLLGFSKNNIEILPCAVNSETGKFYEHYALSVASISVEPGEKYVIKSNNGASTLAYAFATSPEFEIDEDVPVVEGTTVMPLASGERVIVTIPEGCTNLLVNYSEYFGSGRNRLDVQKLQGAEGMAQKRQLRILAIGNSYSQDALAYVPFIMQNMGLDVELSIGILMMSSSTIQDHVNNFLNEEDAYTFYRYAPGAESWSNMGKKTIQYALDTYEWDIILTHQSSADVSSWNTHQPYLNRLVNLIYTKLTYNVKFAWVLSQIRPAQSNSGPNRTEASIISRYEATAVNAERVKNESVFDIVIPVGTAVQNARTIESLKVLGSYKDNAKNTSGYGYLTPNDGVHLQEGLPCQLAAYTVILSILDFLGMNEISIFGETTRVTSAWASGKSIPSPHGSYIGSTDDNCRMAQMCAIMAHKHPYEITDMNYIVNPS